MEEKILLLFSRPFFSKRKLEIEFEKQLQEKKRINFDRVYQLSINNEVAGFVFKNTKNLSIFPDEIKTKLKTTYHQIAFNNIHLLSTTLNILKLFFEKQLPVIPLKGAFASDFLFTDLGVYPSGDIDILVPFSKLPDSKALLCKKGGFIQEASISEQDLLADHYHLMFKRKNVLLEVHWNLVKRYFRIPPDFWWESAKPVEWNRIRTMDLSIENNILYQVFRLFDHCFHPLRFFVLLSGSIHKNREEIDWDILLQTAEDYKMKKLVIFTLLITNDLIPTKIPQSIQCRQPRGYEFLKSLIFSGLFSGVGRKHFRMMIYSLLLINPGTIMQVLIARVFPSKGELRLRYNLPTTSKKIYLYYILNPILLFLRKKE